ncbi:uncharacterized protein ATNIH1004_008092 [Aspergillus tanneri]|uniref:Uncharacterized protein n=1 Tax=Aspergillus tanneri TaxID=1220188 RepID=A0A5M9MDU2_9EURO|nr:uncharacterized protein ATNIH1004_008092 [Aspergillus tanneri]KAA8643896.1 hypothetical protein ATNIH1004_008092 [Aspergillus tanneri]
MLINTISIPDHADRRFVFYLRKWRREFIQHLVQTMEKLLSGDDQIPVVGYFIPHWSATELSYGGWTSTGTSIAGINAAATTHNVGCLKDAPKTDCNIKNSWTIIQGPETVSVAGVRTASTSGKKRATISPSCTRTSARSGPAPSPATYLPATSSYYELVFTAGVEKFTAPEATTPNAAAPGPAGALITGAPVAAAAIAALL